MRSTDLYNKAQVFSIFLFCGKKGFVKDGFALLGPRGYSRRGAGRVMRGTIDLGLRYGGITLANCQGNFCVSNRVPFFAIVGHTGKDRVISTSVYLDNFIRRVFIGFMSMVGYMSIGGQVSRLTIPSFMSVFLTYTKVTNIGVKYGLFTIGGHGT